MSVLCLSRADTTKWQPGYSLSFTRGKRGMPDCTWLPQGRTITNFGLAGASFATFFENIPPAETSTSPVKETLGMVQSPAEQDRQVSEAYEREQLRLRSFIRRRVPDRRDAEDILQEVFTELVEAYRLFETIDQVGAWLFRVARNRIIDLFRKKKPALYNDLAPRANDEGEELSVEELLPSPDAGPEAAFARLMLVEELEAALGELPLEQREAFVANEIEGVSFKELAAQTGVNMNTLLTRKRLAVVYLRSRLQEIYQEYARLQPDQKNEAPAKKPLSQEFKEWVRAVVRQSTPPKGAGA